MMSHTLDLDQIWSWNAEVPETVPGCVHDLIATIAVHHPDALAVCAWDGNLTYSQLNALSRRVAQRLIALRIPRQSSIPLLFSKSRWTCVAMLAIIQAGCAAVALDATQPDTRLRSIVQQTQPKVIISSPVHTTRASGLADASILQLDDALFDNEIEELMDGLPTAFPSDIVYISFTSYVISKSCDRKKETLIQTVEQPVNPKVRASATRTCVVPSITKARSWVLIQDRGFLTLLPIHSTSHGVTSCIPSALEDVFALRMRKIC
jgi:non-ribosomal peptide synthetase component F